MLSLSLTAAANSRAASTSLNTSLLSLKLWMKYIPGLNHHKHSNLSLAITYYTT